MVRRAYRQRSLVEVLLPDADKLWDPTLRRIDAVLDDEVLVDRVTEALAQRHPQSRRRGRLGTPAAVVLRMLVLKHLHDWSFDECERDVRGSLVYRAFCRIDGERVPDAKTLIRLAHLLDESVLKDVLARLVALGRERRLIRGRRMRLDTTVVETNIHYPTDSSLLEDSMRVVTRLMTRIRSRHPRMVGKVVNHRRAVGRRVGAIRHASRIRDKERGEAKRRKAYARLLRIAQGRLHQARRLLKRLSAARRVKDVRPEQLELEHYVALMAKVVAQTQARILDGNTTVKGKILSIFESHTQVIRKGKLRRPNEFGRVVRLDGVEHGVISGYDVVKGNLADSDSWAPALANHVEIFKRAPRLATGDAGFHSKKNEDLAKALGVRHVVLRKPGRLSQDRRTLQKKRWFRSGMRWRTGIEAQIGILKHPFGMDRAVYKRETGFKRHVAACIIANNLVALARTLTRQELARAS